MLRGLYQAASALFVHQLRHENAATNLANVQTPGFRARRLVLSPFAQLLLARLPDAAALGRLDYGVNVSGTVTETAAGPLRETGRPWDVALDGEGFLVVQTDGGERYTRDGRLGVDAEGRLVDVAGRFVLGQAGIIRVPRGVEPVIDLDGTVRAGDQVLGRLRVVRFDRPDLLERTPDGLFAASVGSGAAVNDAGTVVRQGWLESANVDVAAQTVELMAAFRAFEAAQRAIRAQDETLGLAVNELARF